MHRQPVENKRDKSVAVAEGVLRSVEALERKGAKPTFNAILEYLSSRKILSNHRSLRAYLDAMVKTGLLRLRDEPVEQPNVRSKQVYSLTETGPIVEAGEEAMVFHGLNWNVPSKSSIKMKTDIQGLARARIARGKAYASLEDAIVETLAKSKSSQRVSRALTFSAALLATGKIDYGYISQRAKKKGVDDLVQGLLGEINYLLNSPRPAVEDIRTLFEIRRRLSNHPRASVEVRSNRFPLSPDDMIDVIGKQLGVK
jgi:hypothetical protein